MYDGMQYRTSNYLYETALSKMPVATVYKAYGKHDEWRGLRVDKINQYTED